MKGVKMKLMLECRDMFQAEDGIRDLRMSRGLGDVYKSQAYLSIRFSYKTKKPQ
ncbi:hypothetical protein GZ115_11580 [Staphylococcus aureus]|uniref:hypothetical protein n=1 Tax=Staphylococcus aureus TaxID=1280 RepID=UPI00139C36C2|nr:hypothetical protein [Staphylococcus aureus]NDQ66508.1 hypothetical protein [Staphylococcus aureus]